MIPTGTFVRLPAFNAGMVKKYGLPEPAKRMTYAEYKAWLVAAQQKLPKGIYASENDGAWLFVFDSWVAGHGETLFKGKAFGFKPETVTAYLSFWKDLKDAGVLVPVDRIDEQFLSLELRPLARGRALISSRDIPQITQVSQTLASSNLPSEIHFISNPVASPAAKSANVPGANGLSISSSCKNVPTAAAYVNFFSNDPKAALAFQSANGVVVSKTGRQTLLDSPKTPAPVRGALEHLDTLVAANDLAPAPAYPPGYQALQDPLRRAYEGVMRGKAPAAAAKEFLNEAARTIR
jgi:multiple sugar transport system substrate-binding protein